VSSEQPGVAIINKRVMTDLLGGDQECAVCMEMKDAVEFPNYSITRSCKHPPSTCLDCVMASIQSDLRNKLWNEISCPECGEALGYDDVQKYADEATKDQ